MVLLPIVTTLAVIVTKGGLIKAGIAAGTIIYNVCKED